MVLSASQDPFSKSNRNIQIRLRFKQIQNLGNLGKLVNLGDSLEFFKFSMFCFGGLAVRRIVSSFIPSQIYFYFYLFSQFVLQIFPSYLIFLVQYFRIRGQVRNGKANGSGVLKNGNWQDFLKSIFLSKTLPLEFGVVRLVFKECYIHCYIEFLRLSVKAFVSLLGR